MTPSQNKTFSQNPLNIPFTISTTRFHVIKSDQRGHNRMYDAKRSRSFLFELNRLSPDTNQFHLLIHTNDTLVSTAPKEYFSNSHSMNNKYQISKLLTHFFAIQKVIPKRIQHKYFAKIRNSLLSRISFIDKRNSLRQRNRTTKTFFNFTYKKYRFHFRIYVLCNFETTQGFCPLPSPIIMSNHRTACPFHQKWLNTHNTSTDLQPSQKHAAAVTRTYTKSLNAETNTVYSNRLGISYNTQLTVRRKDHPKAPDNTFVYTKKLFNYNVNVSSRSYPYSPSTLKKQTTRRERLLRKLIVYQQLVYRNLGKAEAAEKRLIYNAFKLRIRNIFTGPRPPLISMLNASVGHHSKRDFSKEFSDESNRLYRSESHDDVISLLAFIETSSTLLTDWQYDFHCFMKGSPVPSHIAKAKKGRKKSKIRPMVDVPTYDEIWQHFNELYRLHIVRNLNKIPMFMAQTVK
ncbi:hypothetical protein C1645_866605 [Glomus cerebriforme]|uniref:DUF8211 domain-containing protein n=1 Tax=Glomus cerebriforme TaxID=658196 RepID=A0A397S703_9GLOM|nr:hypothetical protein C1645_866605 [Glomus cerebriforme]